MESSRAEVPSHATLCDSHPTLGRGGQATVTLSLPPSLRGAFEQEISFGVSIDLGGRRVSQGVLVLISQGPIHFGHVRLLQSSEERDYDKYTRVMRGDRKGFTTIFADMTFPPLVPAVHSILFRVFEVDTAAMQGALIMEAGLPVELDSIKSRGPCRVFGPTVVAPPLTPNLFRIEPPQGGVLPPHTMVSVFVTKGTLFPTKVEDFPEASRTDPFGTSLNVRGLLPEINEVIGMLSYGGFGPDELHLSPSCTNSTLKTTLLHDSREPDAVVFQCPKDYMAVHGQWKDLPTCHLEGVCEAKLCFFRVATNCGRRRLTTTPSPTYRDLQIAPTVARHNETAALAWATPECRP